MPSPTTTVALMPRPADQRRAVDGGDAAEDALPGAAQWPAAAQATGRCGERELRLRRRRAPRPPPGRLRLSVTPRSGYIITGAMQRPGRLGQHGGDAPCNASVRSRSANLEIGHDAPHRRRAPPAPPRRFAPP